MSKEFYFDSKYFDIVNKYKWTCRSDGSVTTKVNNHDLSMVKLLFGDNPHTYINGNHRDLRESNVRNLRGYKNNGRLFLNGYIVIYMPGHKKALKNGCVYEHIVEAEKMLGRELLKGECVHHKNHDRQDNRHENLMVFSTQEDHVAFHNGGDAVLTDNGSYVVKKKKIPFYMYNNRTIKDIKNGTVDNGSIYIYGKEICPYCNKNIKGQKAIMCKECRKKENAKNIPSKEELEKLIYKQSFLSIGRKYGVSDNAVRKWCKKYGLPYKNITYKTKK